MRFARVLPVVAAASLVSACATTGLPVPPARSADASVPQPLSVAAALAPQKLPAVPPLAGDDAESPLLQLGVVAPRERPTDDASAPGPEVTLAGNPVPVEEPSEEAAPAQSAPEKVAAADESVPSARVTTLGFALDDEVRAQPIWPQRVSVLKGGANAAWGAAEVAQAETSSALAPADPQTVSPPEPQTQAAALAALAEPLPEGAPISIAAPVNAAFIGSPRAKPAHVAKGGPDVPFVFELRR